MHSRIDLQPVAMTPARMRGLEQRGLIIRLCPGHHALPARPGQTLGKNIYVSAAQRGPHKLITVTVNCATLRAFGSHPDNEEFLLLGDPDTKPLYLVVARLRKKALARKIGAGRLTAADFVCLRVTFNEAQVSFFTMLADVPHGEAVAEVQGRAPSFYVAEPRDIGFEPTDFRDYALCLPRGRRKGA